MIRERTTFGAGSSKIRREMERYESFTNPGKSVNILHWWRKHEPILPILAKIARKIFAIPASSSKSERVFSTGGNIATAKRNRLAPKKVENLILIKENDSKIKDFIEGGEYEIKPSDINNAFKKVEEEVSTVEPVDDDDMFRDNITDLEEEEVVYMNDTDIDSDEEDDFDVDDPNDIAFLS